MECKKSRKALGTDIEVSIITDDKNIERRINWVFDFFDSFEEEFSRFLPLSSLSILNNQKKIKASKRFIDLIRECQILYKKTDWYFNPLVDISTIWYSNSFDENNFIIKERLTDLDFDKIKIDWNTIFLWENQNLDFWWIGKWYAVTLASNFLNNFGYDNYFINAWWDIYASWLNNENDKWVIWIENPFNDKLLASVKISNQSIATSGNYKRKWKIWEANHHHILNPKTWKNKFDIASVTIIADNCTSTDAFTKAVFNMEILDSINFIEKNSLSGMIVLSDWKTFYSKDFIKKFEVIFY